MVVSIGISEKCRNRLGVLICVFCCLLALSGLALIGLGLFMQLHIHDQLILLESYDDGLLPNFLVSVGSIMLLVNIVCAKLSYDCGFAITREKFRLTLVPLLVIIVLLLLVMMIVGLICFVHRSSIEDALHEGLEDAMGRYKDNRHLKVGVDRLQMKNRCCGSRAYTDWFNTGWINPKYINKKDPYVKKNLRTDGSIHVDSVPFSCCDVTVARPCVSNYVLNRTRHVNYDSPTLYMTGCTDVLMDRLQNRILHPAGCFVFALCGIQLLVLVLVRYLQTSMISAYEEGDPEGPGKGFLFPNCCASCTTGDPDKYVKAGALDPSLRAGAGDSADVTFDSGAPDVGFPAGDMDDLGGEAAEMGGNGDNTHAQSNSHGQNGGKHKHDGKSKSKKPKSPKKKKTKSPKKSKSPKKKSKSPKKKKK